MPEDRILSPHRTCEKCTHKDTCWAYHEILDKVNRWTTAGFAGAGAPGWRGDVFVAFAHGCILFEFNKLKNISHGKPG